MKLVCCAKVAVAAGLAMTAAYGASEPQEVFRDPPREAHAGVWWHWMGGQVTKEGIEKDLGWFSRMGITSASRRTWISPRRRIPAET